MTAFGRLDTLPLLLVGLGTIAALASVLWFAGGRGSAVCHFADLHGRRRVEVGER